MIFGAKSYTVIFANVFPPLKYCIFIFIEVVYDFVKKSACIKENKSPYLPFLPKFHSVH